MVMKKPNKQEVQEEEIKETARNPPVANFRAGNISVSVFEKKLKNEKGEFTVHSVNLQKAYKNKEGDWQNMSVNLNKHDITKAKLVLNKAEEYLLMTGETTQEED